MANQSLYRKYRPQTFSDVVGQEHIENTLRNALANDRVSHAYLFCGPRGTGKTTTARLLAKALLCDQAPTANPDGVCQNCHDIAEGMHPDVYELDAASRTGVDNVREEIINRVAFLPTRGRWKVYIIDEVHMLSIAAFNALLKTLEEPPSHVVFVLCTTDPQKVPATIISRCQRFDFHSLSTQQIGQCLAQICQGERFEVEPGALELIANQAKGGMRDAITALEQVAVFGNGTVTYAAAENMFGDVDTVELSEVVDCIARRDPAACFLWVDKIAVTGIDVAQVVKSLTAYVRNMYVVALMAARGAQVEDLRHALPAMSDEAVAKLAEQARAFGSADRLASLLVTLGDLSTELKYAMDSRLALEVALTKMAHPTSDLTLEALAARIDALESGSVMGSQQLQPLGRPDGAAGFGGAFVQGAGAVQAPQPQPFVEPQRAPQQGSAQPQPQAQPQQASQPQPQPQPQATQPQPQPQPQPQQAPQPQAAQPQPQPASNDGSSGLMRDPSSLRRIWDAAIREVSRLHPMVPSLLGGARPHADIANMKIVVELPHDAEFARGTLMRGDTNTDMQKAIAKMFGAPITLEYVLGDPREAQRQNPSSEPMSGGFAAAPASGNGSAQISAPASAPAPAAAAAPRGDAADSGQPARQQASQPRQAPQAQSQQQAPRVQPQSQSAPAPAPEAPVDYLDDEPPIDQYDAYADYDDDGYDQPPMMAPQARQMQPQQPSGAQQASAPQQPVPASKPVSGDQGLAQLFNDVFGNHVEFRDPAE